MTVIIVGDINDTPISNTSILYSADSIDFTIFWDLITNTSIVNDVVNISFPVELLPDVIDNTPANFIPTDNRIDFIINGTTITNTSTMYNGSVSFIILPNIITNTSTVYGPPYIDILSMTLYPDVITNTSIIYNAMLSFPIYPDVIINTSIIYGDNNIIQDVMVYPDVINNVNKVYPFVIGFKDIPVVGKEIIRKSQNVNINKNFLFSDFSLDFLPHPVTGDIARLYDADAINQSLKNILLTKKFERPFEHFSVASQIRSLLFSLSDNLMSMELRSEIFQVIVNNEPRINLLDIIIDATPNRNELHVRILYKIKTFDKVLTFKTIITRT